MTIQTNLNDRKELARRMIPFNRNEKLHYTGTPAFAYEGQGFRILRSGDIECDDEKTEAAITAFLQEAGILPQPKPEEGTETEVTQEPTQQDETPESEALPQTEPDKMKSRFPMMAWMGRSSATWSSCSMLSSTCSTGPQDMKTSMCRTGWWKT